MRAPCYCAWCLAEGYGHAQAFLGWTETASGKPSHGICTKHAEKLVQEMEMRLPTLPLNSQRQNRAAAARGETP